MNTIQRLLQKLIPDKINFYKETIDGLTGQVIAPKYYLSVEDYYKINETINDLICAINFVIDNSNIDFSSYDTLTTSIKDVIISCPVITAVNGLSTTGIKNYDVLTSFYLNGKKYQYNLINQGNIHLNYNFISGTMGDYVTTINGEVDNTNDKISGFNKNSMTGGISGISINNKVYYPFSTYYWNSTITSLPSATTIKNKEGKNIFITEEELGTVTNISTIGYCNGFKLTGDMELNAAELITFRINSINDKYLSAYTSAFFENLNGIMELILLTSSSTIPIDLNLKVNVNGKEYYLSGDILFYTKGINKPFKWNSSIILLPPFTYTENNVYITLFESVPVNLALCSGICNGIVLSSNSLLTSSFNGRVDLGSYCKAEENYITNINGKSLQHMFLLSGIKYENQIYPDVPSLTINKNNMYIPSSSSNNLIYNNQPLTLLSGDLTNNKSAITYKQLKEWSREEIIRKIKLTSNIINIGILLFPLHLYDINGNYIRNGILNITLEIEEGLKVNKVKLKYSNGWLTVMKVRENNG